MTKETRKKLESAFYEYKKNRNISICETLNCIASKHLTTNYDKIPVKSSGINCAEDAIIRLLDANTERYKWCKVVEKTLERFYGEHKDIRIFFTRPALPFGSAGLALHKKILYNKQKVVQKGLPFPGWGWYSFSYPLC